MSNPNSEQNMPYFLNKICQESNYKNIKKEIEKIAKKATLFKGLTSRKFYDNDDSPFAIELSMGKNVNRNLFHLGYGVSQALPILATISFSGVPNKVLLIQQPEVHLHPKAQVAIGDLIFDKASKKFTNFVIETHSDHIIDRFRYAQKKSKDKKVSSQVVFFARKTKGNSLYTIDIEKDGKYSEKQPKSFRDFFLKESMKLLEL